MAEGATLNLQNFTLSNYLGSLLRSTDQSTLSIASSKFINLNLEGHDPLIKIEGKNGITNFGQKNTVKNTLFQNISVQTSLFLAQNGVIPVTFDNITMDDIRKIIIGNNDIKDLQDDTDLPISLCFTGSRYISLNVSQSTFSNINSNCISLRYSTMTLKASIFNNAALNYPPNELIQNTSSENYGVSWISFYSGTTIIIPFGIITISSCQFIQNKIFPKFGGVRNIFFDIYSILT